MNVTEDVRDPWFAECDRLICPRFIETEVKSFVIKHGKNAVKNNILVRKSDHGPYRHNQEMRFKLLVFLHQLKVPVLLDSKICTPNSARNNGLKPDGDIRVVFPLAGGRLVRRSNLTRHSDLLSWG